jgi:hypothetical protein
MGLDILHLDVGGTRQRRGGPDPAQWWWHAGAAGNALTLVDGRTGAGVTTVTIERSDGSSVQATVFNGRYLAWWPGTVVATNAEVTTASATSTVVFPSAPTLAAPDCPSGAHCAASYSYGSASGASRIGQSTMRVQTRSVSSSQQQLWRRWGWPTSHPQRRRRRPAPGSRQA